MYLICSANVSLGFRVKPNIFGKGFVARLWLSDCRLRDLKYSAGLEVKRMAWILFVIWMQFFSVAQLVSVFRLKGLKVITR